MSKLLNHLGEPIEKMVDESKLPSTEQILQDPITKKFVFLNSDAYPDQTCICLLYTSPSPRDGLLSRMPSSA